MIKKLSILFILTVLTLNCNVSRAWYFRDFLFSISCVLMNAKTVIEIPDLMGSDEQKERTARDDICVSAFLDVVWIASKSCQNVENDLIQYDKNSKLKFDKKS